MAKCSVKPYEGTEKYIFVSYSHRDSDQVFPLIERIARDGYRIWYDEGIEPGSEWPESIAQHLNGCGLCLAFLSPRYLDSHNCRQEIHFALSKEKNILSIELEPVNMSLGMEMLLSDTQFIMKYAQSSEEEFFSKLYSARSMEGCAAAPAQEAHRPGISPAISGHAITEGVLAGRIRAKIIPMDDRGVFVDEGPQDGPQINKSTWRPVQQYPLGGEDTDCITDEQFRSRQGHTADGAGPASPWLSRINTGETIRLSEGTLKLGRSQAMSDYVIPDNMTVSRAHAQIVTRGGRCVLSDLYTSNKTCINGQELSPGKEYPLKDGDMILLATEQFQFHER